VVLFDFGGTLDADGVYWAPRFHAAYRAAGGALEFPAFEPYFKASERELARLPGIRTLGFRAMVDAEARLVCGKVPDGGRVDAAVVAREFHSQALDIVARNRPVLDRLAARHRLGVVSNFTGNLEPCLVELELRHCFTVVTDSTLAGVTKPDPRIFTETLERLDAPAAAAWMVGDNFEADIRPAAALGMRTCWIAAPDRRAPADAAPTARVARLPDVEAALRDADPCTG